MNLHDAKAFILKKLQDELPGHLSYHSIDHVKDVYQAAENIAKSEKISNKDLDLLLTAALFHDSGFLKQEKDHERISTELAREHLPEFGYANSEIEIICGMISATKIPQTPKNILEQIICDADLDYLGRDDFFTIGNKLFEEMKFFGIVHNADEWNKLQIRFLEKHHYFTPTSIRLRKKKKDEHLAKLKNMKGTL